MNKVLNNEISNDPIIESIVSEDMSNYTINEPSEVSYQEPIFQNEEVNHSLNKSKNDEDPKLLILDLMEFISENIFEYCHKSFDGCNQGILKDYAEEIQETVNKRYREISVYWPFFRCKNNSIIESQSFINLAEDFYQTISMYWTKEEFLNENFEIEFSTEIKILIGNLDYKSVKKMLEIVRTRPIVFDTGDGKYYQIIDNHPILQIKGVKFKEHKYDSVDHNLINLFYINNVGTDKPLIKRSSISVFYGKNAICNLYKCYESMTYEPYNILLDNCQLKFTDPSNVVFNKYVSPVENEAINLTNEQEVYFQEFLKDFKHNISILCDFKEERISWLWQYIAYMVQKPFIPVPLILYFKSQQGCGKDTFLKIMSNLLGKTNVKETTGSEAITGKYNDWLVGATLFTLNECDDLAKAQSVLKSLANGCADIEMKYKSRRQMDIFVHLMIFTNLDIFKPEYKTRREVLFECSTVTDEVREFYKTLYSKYGSDFKNVPSVIWKRLFHYFTKEVNVSEFSAHRLPQFQVDLLEAMNQEEPCTPEGAIHCAIYRFKKKYEDLVKKCQEGKGTDKENNWVVNITDQFEKRYTWDGFFMAELLTHLKEVFREFKNKIISTDIKNQKYYPSNEAVSEFEIKSKFGSFFKCKKNFDAGLEELPFNKDSNSRYMIKPFNEIIEYLNK